MTDEIHKQYEITLLISPQATEEEIQSLKEEFKKDIKTLGGDLKTTGEAEKRNLAYPIKKFQLAYYLTASFTLASEKVKELNSLLKHKKNILRYLTVVVAEEKPRPLTKKRGEEKIKKIAEEIIKQEKKIPKEKISQKKVKEKKEEKVKLEEIDKKLDEILGI